MATRKSSKPIKTKPAIKMTGLKTPSKIGDLMPKQGVKIGTPSLKVKKP